MEVSVACCAASSGADTSAKCQNTACSQQKSGSACASFSRRNWESAAPPRSLSKSDMVRIRASRKSEFYPKTPPPSPLSGADSDRARLFMPHLQTIQPAEMLDVIRTFFIQRCTQRHFAGTYRAGGDFAHCILHARQNFCAIRIQIFERIHDIYPIEQSVMLCLKHRPD